ncbi:MAG: multidrug effflux MFS transporter [Candidatus Sedimenticola endophacoides]
MLPPKAPLTTALIAALVALGPLATDMYLPAFPTLMREFGVGIAATQQTLSVFLVGFALAQLTYGPLSDRFGRKPALNGGLLLFALSSYAITLASDMATLTALRLLQALGASAGPVLGRAMVRDIHGPRDSARLLSYIGTAMALAPAVAPLLGGYMTVLWGWSSIFLFLAAYAVLGLAFSLRIPETAPAHGRAPSTTLLGGFAELLRHPAWRWYTLACGCVFGGLFAFLSGSPFIIIDFLGYPEQRFGLFFALVVAGFMAGTLLGGRLSQRHGTDPLIRAGAAVALVGGLGMALPALLGIHHISAIIIPQMIYMVGVGIVMPQSMAGTLAPFPHIAGASSALLGFIQMSLAALAGILVGRLHDGGPLAMSLTIAALGALTLLSAWRLPRPAPPCPGAGRGTLNSGSRRIQKKNTR